ncbi:MAG: TraR/DksA C4-type zinc finger protein [Dehalococcoidia bacterium]|nr:TraR/DksA C4-type zinc finger protein [Dehalococcoidia bacterium]
MPVDIAKVRVRLEGDKKKLLAELDQLMVLGRPSGERREGSPFGKREEEATESLELERRLALEQGIKVQLVDVEVALGKIAAGTYGKCETCGKPIEPARLDALPQAKRCMSCKILQAKNAKTR